jgi:protein kinase-like protein
MGVIYAAYDPQLERSVAVKLVHVVGRDGSGALAEAKALARLAHPNVVAIFDYGFVDEHLYIVMELVNGQTLRRWVKGRTRREIVRAYRQAGEALAAAHAASLIHRDFKPDNAIMGVDDRVRVVDFGLACEVAGPSPRAQPRQRAAGTPRYMAPEQMSGAPITAAADQFSFCAALREALQGERRGADARSTPRWIQAVLARGQSTAPHDRYPSMRALLDALARDPGAVRRRWLVAGTLAAAGVAAFVSGRAASNARDHSCDGGDARLATTWGQEGLAEALHRLDTLGPGAHVLAVRIGREIDEHSRRWAGGYRDACLASVHDLQSRALTDRRMACLEEGRAAMKAVGEIVRTTGANQLSELELAVHALPDPERCGDLNALLADAAAPPTGEVVRVAALRAMLEEARVQIAAGRHDQALPLAEATVAAARALSYKPLLAEALLVQGRAAMDADDRAAADQPLTEAFTGAFRSGLFSLAVEAWARRAWALATSVGGQETLAGLDVVDALAANKQTSTFARALLHNNVGCVYLALEKRDRARAEFERAAAEARGVTGPGAVELLNINVNLGLVTDDPAHRDQLFGAAVAEKARILGEDHPATLDSSWQRGAMSERFDDALAILEPTCAALDGYGGYRASECWLETAFIKGERADVGGAAQAMARVVSLRAENGSSVALATGYMHLWRGSARLAARELAATASALPDGEAEPWWSRFERAEAELGLGRALVAAGSARNARGILSSSLSRFEAIARTEPSPRVTRRVGRARAELARVLATLHAPGIAVATLAAPAATYLRAAGGSDAEIANLERLSR